jgi:outer membrane protein insertion porin family
LRFDSRDNALAPTRGLFSYLSYEYATPWLGSGGQSYSIGYTRAQARLDCTFPLPVRSSLYLSFRTGLERSLVDPVNDPLKPGSYLTGSGSIPLSKKFALGGAGSLRGFREQELNFADESLLGAISYVNYRAQLDFPFTGQLRFGPFADAANLQLDQYSLSENLRFGYGFGFHYLTPVGPVNLDWGFKHKPRPGETLMEFYFSIGIL